MQGVFSPTATGKQDAEAAADTGKGGTRTLGDAACLSSMVTGPLQTVHLTELLQCGHMLQDHFGKGPLHEVGIHGVSCQHRLVGLHTGPHRSVKLHQGPATQALHTQHGISGPA